MRTVWVAVLLGVSLMLTPAVWAVDVINPPNSINPVAGSGTATFGGGGGRVLPGAAPWWRARCRQLR